MLNKNDFFLVSIIMPVYNAEKYVERALLSVFNQTYNNIELIIVDDCSCDSSLTIIANVLKKDDYNKITRLYHHTHNRGASAARNTGVNNARGEYIFFIDSDDEMTLDCIEKLMNIVFQYPNVELVTGNATFLDESGFIIDDQRYFSDRSHIESYEYIDNKLMITNLLFNYSSNIYIPVTPWNKLYSNRWLRDNSLSFVEGIVHEDEMFIFDIANVINCIGICYDVTYLRYINPNSVMTSMSIERSVKSWVKIFNTALRTLSAPLLNLKVRYCLAELKRLLFCVSVKDKSHINDIKNTVGDFLKFSLKNMLFKNAIYCLMLIFLPITIRDYSVVYKLYSIIFKYENLLKVDIDI